MKNKVTPYEEMMNQMFFELDVEFNGNTAEGKADKQGVYYKYGEKDGKLVVKVLSGKEVMATVYFDLKGHSFQEGVKAHWMTGQRKIRT